jgi:dTMP kinase
MEQKIRAFHRRVRAGYLRIASREPRRVVVVNAARPAETVWQQVEAIVKQRVNHFV